MDPPGYPRPSGPGGDYDPSEVHLGSFDAFNHNSIHFLEVCVTFGNSKKSVNSVEQIYNFFFL